MTHCVLHDFQLHLPNISDHSLDDLIILPSLHSLSLHMIRMVRGWKSSLRDPFHVNDLFDHYSFTMIQLLNMFLPPCKIRSPKKSVVGGLMLTVDHFAKELVILKYTITVLVILPIGLDWVAQL